MKNLFQFLILFIIIGCVHYSCTDMKQSQSLVYLKNENLTVGILPSVGGRVVYFSLNGSENVLKSDSLLWQNAKENRPPIEANTPFKAYNGHINWLGPQSDWWVQQDEDLKKKSQKDVWPPDPYLIYGDYQLIKHSTNELIIRGPESKFTGTQLTKSFELIDNNTILLTVDVKNIINREINWDIWFNTRLEGFNQCYVPVNDIDEIIIKERNTGVPYQIKDGFFTFRPDSLPGKIDSYNEKAFIYPSKPFIAGFNKGQMILIEFQMHLKTEIHPEQALVEIYNNVNTVDASEGLLELEYHSPYYNFKPGESKSAWEKWHLYSYDGSDNMDQQIAFINLKMEELERESD